MNQGRILSGWQLATLKSFSRQNNEKTKVRTKKCGQYILENQSASKKWPENHRVNFRRKNHTLKRSNLISQDTDLQDAKFTWVLDEAMKLTHPGHKIVTFRTTKNNNVHRDRVDFQIKHWEFLLTKILEATTAQMKTSMVCGEINGPVAVTQTTQGTCVLDFPAPSESYAGPFI